MPISGGLSAVGDVVLAAGGDVQAPAEVFNEIFLVFLGLGTIVGVVVIAYTLYNAYKYRYREDEDPEPDADRPELGEIPEGGGKGKKLFLSFGMSAIIVLSLVAWTYGALVAIEEQPDQATQQGQEALDVRVQGFQFGWQFVYPNGHESSTLRVPADRMVNLTVTSEDVMHNFGIPELRVKTDAIPGQTTNTWFVAEETKTHQANCYELCGEGHSGMNAEVIVMEPDEYKDWYEGTNGTATDESTSSQGDGGGDDHSIATDHNGVAVP